VLEKLGFVGWDTIEPQILSAMNSNFPVLMIGNHGTFKAQPLYSLIKVPNGWKRMGDIQVGNIVCTPDGKTASVTGVFPQGIKDVYRVTFKDGRVTNCCGDHLWKIFKHQQGWKIFDLNYIKNYISKYKEKIFVPLSKEVYGEEVDLPIDPYVFGALLGDGRLNKETIRLSNTDKFIVSEVSKRLIETYYLNPHKDGNNFTVTSKEVYGTKKEKGTFTNKYKEIFNNFSLLVNSPYKFIPEIYKETSYEQRLELVQGLMDTDGGADHGVNFTTSSHRLASDMQYMIRSLGGLCQIDIRKSYYTDKGIKKEGKTSFKLSIRHSTPEIFFKLENKRNKAKRALEVELKLQIKKVTYLGKQECQCILVNHPDHLYITDNFITTHNTDGTEILVKSALGQNAIFGAYDTPNLQYDDLIGYVNPKQFDTQTDITAADNFVKTPFTIWKKDAALFDEITLANPFMQGKLNEIIRKRTIMGLPTNLKLVFAAANPPTSYDTMFMPLPLASRFCIVEVPSLQTIAPAKLSDIINLNIDLDNIPNTLQKMFKKASQVTIPDSAREKINELLITIFTKLKEGGHKVIIEGRTLVNMNKLLISFFKLKDGNTELCFKTSYLPSVLGSVIPEGFPVLNSAVQRATIESIIRNAVANFSLNTLCFNLTDYIKSEEVQDSLIFKTECLTRIHQETDLNMLQKAHKQLQKVNVAKLNSNDKQQLEKFIKLKCFSLTKLTDNMTINEVLDTFKQYNTSTI